MLVVKVIINVVKPSLAFTLVVQNMVELVSLKMSRNQKYEARKQRNSNLNYLRIFFFTSGIILTVLLFWQREDSHNSCIWLTMYSLNTVAAFIACIQPRFTGEFLLLGSTELIKISFQDMYFGQLGQ